ncbi:T9SS type B sorting domain-containing protein [Rasiella sp. SM2506]|uniref:T9SS type B sorting domain-containing protein n=1 Tax=Rasiella sp. SM2506 TaxID=3423914 RepID=UPI003D78DC5E
MRFLFALLFLAPTTFLFSQNPNDCEFALVVCGTTSLGLDPTGVGFDEFSLPGNIEPSCYTFDSNTIWLKLNIISDGEFTFDIVPANGVDDYDFAIYGPTSTCTTLGSPIRCSSTNPQDAGVPAETGLNLTETDVTEGPGPDGNGYLKFIEAQAGDSYFILIDRAVGSEGFDFRYTGSAGLPDGVTANEVDNLISCDADGTLDGFTPFDLDALIPAIQGNQNNTTVTFHSSLNDANIGINNLISPYINNANPQTIYARLESNNGCSDISQFTIETGNPALSKPADVALCSYDTSEMYNLDLIQPVVISDPNNYVFSYHLSNNDAILNTNPIGPIVTLTETSLEIFVRVEDPTFSDCFSVTSFNAFINKIKLASQPSDFLLCDDDFDTVAQFDLTEKDSEILGNLPSNEFVVRYYSSVTDREQDINRILEVFTNTSNPQPIYAALVELSTGCFDVTQFALLVRPKPIPIFDNEPHYYCLQSTDPIEISVQPGFNFYSWSTQEEGPDLSTISITEPGSYSVTVTNEFGCTNTVTTEVLPSDIATIVQVIVTDFNFPNNTITVLVEGPGDYEYALDKPIIFQDSNVFENPSFGEHLIFVRDKNGCGTVTDKILVLDYPRVLTPNQDGFHDTWQIPGISAYPKAKIYIFDRYGKLLKQISSLSSGWDGTYHGKKLPSSDYWFRILLEDTREIKGHFTLKR